MKLLLALSGLTLLFSQLSFAQAAHLKATETQFFIPIPPKKVLTRSHSMAPTNAFRDLMLYMIATYINPEVGSIPLVEALDAHHYDLAIVDEASVAKIALEKYRQASHCDTPTGAFEILKPLFMTSAYLDIRKWHHSRFPIPSTLKEFEKQYPFNDWQKNVIAQSSVKGCKRIIYRNGLSVPNISVAQTELPDGSSARETEVIISREDLSGQSDFFVYNANGELVSHSLFHNSKGKDIKAAAPYTCLTCHYRSNEGVFGP
jgi:hypothetical protein